MCNKRDIYNGRSPSVRLLIIIIIVKLTPVYVAPADYQSCGKDHYLLVYMSVLYP